MGRRKVRAASETDKASTRAYTAPPMKPTKTIAAAACVLGTFLGIAAACQELPPRDDPKPAPPASQGVVFEGGAGIGAGKHIVLVAGDEEYRSEEALPMLARLLSVRHGFRCTLLFSTDPETGAIDPDNRLHLPGLQALASADLLVLFVRFRRLPDEDMRHVVEYVESGKPVIGIRTATHAFIYEPGSASPYARWAWDSAEWPGGFGQQVLGETWVSHHGAHGKESTRGVVPEAVKDHPVLRGVHDVWGPTDVYGIRVLPPDARVLLEGSIHTGMEPDAPAADDARNAPRMPIAWIRERSLGEEKVQRVFASTIGASVDLRSEDLRRLYVNACLWAVGREERIPARADARVVGAYEPTMFGFGTWTRGVMPRDHALAATPESAPAKPPK